MISSCQGGQNIHKYFEDGPPEFPDIQEDHFQLKDKSTISELQNLHKNSVLMVNPIQNLGGTMDEQAQYRLRQDKLISIFDSLDDSNIVNTQTSVLPQVTESFNTPYPNFEYYDLKDVDYDDKQAITDAFAFLQSLKPTLAEKIEKMDIDVKPIFRKKTKVIEKGAPPTTKLTKQMQVLSFQDE